MTKWFGKIGFSVTEEIKPGIWKNHIVEKSYRGDMKKVSRRWQNGTSLNDDITISNELSIVADPYILENLTYNKYVLYQNVKWKITTISPDRPRMTLTLGGIYNENES